MRECVSACVRACVRACAYAYVFVCFCECACAIDFVYARACARVFVCAMFVCLLMLIILWSKFQKVEFSKLKKTGYRLLLKMFLDSYTGILSRNESSCLS